MWRLRTSDMCINQWRLCISSWSPTSRAIFWRILTLFAYCQSSYALSRIISLVIWKKVFLKVFYFTSYLKNTAEDVYNRISDIIPLLLSCTKAISTLITWQVPDYCPALDEEGICKMAFEIIFAFDEVVSLGHKENITIAQVKQYTEMESHEERLHNLIIQSKIQDTKDTMQRKVKEIEKSKVSSNAIFSSCDTGILIFFA